MDQKDFALGQLTASVEGLVSKVDALEKKVDTLTEQANKGKGFAFGMLLAAGGVGAGIATTIGKLFGK